MAQHVPDCEDVGAALETDFADPIKGEPQANTNIQCDVHTRFLLCNMHCNINCSDKCRGFFFFFVDMK